MKIITQQVQSGILPVTCAWKYAREFMWKINCLYNCVIIITIVVVICTIAIIMMCALDSHDKQQNQCSGSIHSGGGRTLPNT